MTVFENKKNLAYGVVLVAPVPALSGTSLVLASGHGARMPIAPFMVIASPPNTIPDASNAEFILVSSVSGDTLTISRGQRGTAQKSIEAGWNIFSGPSAETFLEIENAINALESDTESMALDIAALNLTAPSALQKNAMAAANSPSGTNAFATMADLGGGSPGPVGFSDITGAPSDNTSLALALAGKQPLSQVLTDTTAPFTVAHAAKIETIDMAASTLSTGLVACSGMAVNADPTKYDVGTVVADFVDHYTDPFNPTAQRITFAPILGITTPFLASHDETYVGINSSGVIVQKTSEFDSNERRDIVVLGAISHAGRVEVEDTDIEPYLATTIASTMMDYIVNRGSFNVSGNEYFHAGVGLTIQRSAGKTFDLAGNYALSIKSPNIIETPESNPDVDVYYYYRGVDGAWVNDGPPVGAIDPNYYDGGIGVGKTAVPAGKWTIQPVFFYAPWVATDIQYGQKLYDTYEAALSNLRDNFIINPWIGNWDTFRAWMIVQEGSTSLSGANFVSAGREGLVSGISGGGGGEINIGANIGTGGAGVFAGKSGVELQFKNLLALSSKITVTDNATDGTIDLDVSLTGADVGLGNVDNTSDANKPVSTAVATALSGKADLVGGVVPANQLPGFVDDVIEAANFAALPVTGEQGKVYVTIDNGKTYRWSGSAYVVIGNDLALGETSATAYRGDRGKTAYDHSQLVASNPHGVTASMVGLGSVDNTSDLDKPISTATATALAGKAASTHNHDLSYAPLAHASATSNPHGTTAAQVGADPTGTASSAVAAHVALSDPHTQYQRESEKGVANGYASLDASGKVPSAQIPAGGGGRAALVPVVKTGVATLTNGENFVIADMTSGSYTLTLPASPSDGLDITVVKHGTNENATLTIAINGSQIIGQALTTWPLTERNSFVTLVYVASLNAWRVSSRPTFSAMGFRRRGAATPRIYSSPMAGTALTTGAPASGVIHAMPFVAENAVTIDQMLINVTTLGSGSSAAVGIYSDVNNAPASLIVDCGSISTASTGVKTYTAGLPLSLAPGLYWLVYVCSATAPTIRCFAVGGLIPVMGLDTSLGTAQGFGWQATLALGALPSTFPSAGLAVKTAVPLPVVGVRFSD